MRVKNPRVGKHYKTIAFVSTCRGGDAKICAEFGKKIVDIGNDKFKFKNDLDHPNTIYIIHNSLEVARKIAYCYGADLLIKVDNGKSSIEAITEDGAESAIYSPLRNVTPEKIDEDLEKAIEMAISWQNKVNSKEPRMLNAAPTKESAQSDLPAQIKENLQENKKARIKAASEYFGENGVEGGIDLLVLGGAGPAASADFVDEFVNREGFSETLVHISLNQCPGKFKYIAEEGPTFLPYYRNAMEFANAIGAKKVVTPCNTNHIAMDEDVVNAGQGWIEPKYKKKVIDYRDALVEKLKELSVSKILLLGTKATTTKYKLYHESLENADITPITAKEKRENVIMKAIFLIKEGNKMQAKSLINQVIEEERAVHGEELLVVLACTELPLVYTDQEIKNGKLICISSAAIDFFFNSKKRKEITSSKTNLTRHVE